VQQSEERGGERGRRVEERPEGERVEWRRGGRGAQRRADHSATRRAYHSSHYLLPTRSASDLPHLVGIRRR
jgi:hypothetical protein